MTQRSIQDIRFTFKGLLDHLRIATSNAKTRVPDGVPQFIIAGRREDGTGSITASWDAEPFLDDFEELLRDGES